MTEQSRPSGVERFLNLFTRVRPGEATTALLLALNVFLILFLAPVYVPVNLLHGWIQTVAQVNPVTPMLEAARGLLQGDLVSIGAAFGCAVALLVVALPCAVRGLRSAERAG